MSGSSLGMKSRLDFFDLDLSSKPDLEKFGSTLQQHLPEILDGFYEHVSAQPSLAEKIEAHGPAERLKAAQTEHWMALMSGVFDRHYYERAERIGKAHQHIGLKPTWYIGGYAYVVDRMIKLALAHDSETARMLSSVMKAVLLDMDIAVSVYLEEAEEVRREEHRRLANQLEEKIGHITAAVVAQSGTMSSVVEQLDRAVDELGDKSVSVAGASDQAAFNVEAVSAAVEEMSATVAEIGHRAEQSSKIARTAVNAADHSNTVIQGLSQYASEVDAIVKTISAIAAQTNLLALNATIEAARAGEFGKGFAVVASEVKALANQTSSATKTIGDQIDKITGAVEEAAKSIDMIGVVIKETEQNSTAASEAVEQQALATNEISSNIAQTAERVRGVRDDISSVASETKGMGDMSGKVRMSCDELARISDELDAAVKEVLASLRASEKAA
jgi:methyl-accepting chemotaxis protein